MKSKNEKVENFLDELAIIDDDKFKSIIEMRNIVFTIYPNTEERMMYGGILFSLGKEDFGGLFVHKNHISFEFSNGYNFTDPNNYLEGTGKFRRHLKIKSNSEIKNKNVEYFVKQAL